MFWRTTPWGSLRFGWTTIGTVFSFFVDFIHQYSFWWSADSYTTTDTVVGTSLSLVVSATLATSPRGENSGRDCSAALSSGGESYHTQHWHLTSFSFFLQIFPEVFTCSHWKGTWTTLQWRCHSTSCSVAARSSTSPPSSAWTRAIRLMMVRDGNDLVQVGLLAFLNPKLLCRWLT